MAVSLFNRAVKVTIKEYRAIVACNNHERVFGEVQPVECFEDLACCPVQLLNDIPAHAAGTGFDKGRLSHARHMRLKKSDIEEEWIVRVACDVVD